MKFKITTMPKSKYAIVTAALLFVFIANSKAQQANFSGAWVRNTEKCQVGEETSINSIPIELIIKQSSSQLEIMRNSKNRLGESSTYTEKPNLDGSPVVSVVKPSLNKKSHVEWMSDQKQLILTADYNDDQANLLQKIKETWSLSNDGKSLVIKAVLTANDQEYPMLEVFDKK